MTTRAITIGGITYTVTTDASGDIRKVVWSGHDVTNLLPEAELARIRAGIEREGR